MNQDELLIECERLRAFETLDECHGHLQRLVDQLGFKSYLYGVIPNRRNSLDFEPRSTFDPTWLDYYVDKGLAQVDGVLKRCQQPAAQLIVWRDVEPHMTPAQRNTYRQAIEAGCTNGVTLSMKSHVGVTGAFSVTSEGSAEEALRLLESRSYALGMISYAFNDAVLERFFDHCTQAWKPRLTVRETEVLRWLAEGYTNDQIADRLSISLPTVRKHVNSAKQKLGVRNSVAACAMALKWGFIR